MYVINKYVLHGHKQKVGLDKTKCVEFPTPQLLSNVKAPPSVMGRDNSIDIIAIISMIIVIIILQKVRQMITHAHMSR